MAKEFSAEFYGSPQWKKCRDGFKASKKWLCERCLAKGLIVPGVIAHHIVELTPDNVNDPSVALNYSNLQLLCRECHAEVHGIKKTPERYKVDEMGRVTIK